MLGPDNGEVELSLATLARAQLRLGVAKAPIGACNKPRASYSGFPGMRTRPVAHATAAWGAQGPLDTAPSAASGILIKLPCASHGRRFWAE